MLTDTNFAPCLALGLVYGYVAWPLMFRLVGPIYRLVKLRDNTPVADAVGHVVIFFFLLMVTLAVLGLLGWAYVTRQPGRSEFGSLFFGSWAGMLLSGVIPRIEHALRGGTKRHGAGPAPGP